MPASETVIVIPAFNEEEWIGRTIDLVRATKVPAKIIVVNDGSADRTSEIAASKGATVIDLPKNFGKAAAFYAGTKEALKFGPKAVIVIDADMTEISAKALSSMARQAKELTVKRKPGMIIAPFREGTMTCFQSNSSGIRAFSAPALYELRASKFKGVPRGLGMDQFLNRFFAGRTAILKIKGFYARSAFKGDTPKEKQFRETHLTLARVKRRMKSRKSLR